MSRRWRRRQSASTGRRSITRAGEGRAIETTELRPHLYPAADLLNKRLIPIIAEIRARSFADFGDLIRHPGEEYAFVVEGEVELHTELYSPVRLKAGDSIYFDSGMGHAYINVGKGVCRILSVCSGAETQLIEASRGREPDETAANPGPACVRPVADQAFPCNRTPVAS